MLDDDSSKLSEVLELFSNVTLPLKVEKLIKVSNKYKLGMHARTVASTEIVVFTLCQGE